MTAAGSRRRLVALALLAALLLGVAAECDDRGWDDGVIHASATTSGSAR